jgi:hypothetical protein
MSEQIGLNKTVFDRNSFLNTVNTSFSEISNPAIIVEALPTVAEFFQNYQQLFYNIPVEGGSNSHEYLVKVSGQYINAENFDENLQPLIAEIDSLRATNLELERRIILLTTSGSL